jgi:hypothetical protein
MSSNATDYKYDVAFSFLVRDESLAIQINDLLQERLSTFIYTDRQQEIAGTDGEKTFSEVFGTQARIVAVFYREEWGTTPWTRIEETAIRNRAYEEGYDFVLFIPMESTQKVPKWLPKTQIWIGFEQWGNNGAASVIEARVQSAGGTPKTETAIERAKRRQRDLDRKRARREFLDSDNGVKAAFKEVQSTFSELDELRNTIEQTGWTLERYQPRSKDAFFLYGCGITLALAWGCAYSNTLENSRLLVRIWSGRIGWPNTFHVKDPVKLHEYLLTFDTEDVAHFGWKGPITSDTLQSSKQVAEFCMRLLVDAIHERQTRRYK